MMRLTFLLLLFVCTDLAQAQTRSGVIRVRKKNTKVICLNGYTDGAIPPHAICGGKGLFVTNTDQYRIKSFVILVETFKQVEVQFNSNVVSGDICETIAGLKSNDVIYINKIVAIDNTTGREVNMPPLRFQVRSALIDDRRQRYRQQENEDNH